MATAEGCLPWIDDYGDRDGDGFQEYQTRSKLGYENVAWKDSGDAVLYPDGTLVKGPKALCELQGYVYAGWRDGGDLRRARQAGPGRGAAREGGGAVRPVQRGVLGRGTRLLCLGLDGDKKQVLSVASNVGHCLWTGMFHRTVPQRVVERLMAPDMFSGWGIRTLSAEHVAFNPISYHNGSVWPHDNGLIARGFKRYGFGAEAARVARAVSGAAAFSPAPGAGALCRDQRTRGFPGAVSRRERAAGLGGGLGFLVLAGGAGAGAGCGERVLNVTRNCRIGCRM